MDEQLISRGSVELNKGGSENNEEVVATIMANAFKQEHKNIEAYANGPRPILAAQAQALLEELTPSST